MTSTREKLAAFLLSRPVRRGPAGFLDALAVPWEGYLYLRANPRLWRYAVLPLLAQIALTALAIAGFLLGVSSLYHALGGYLSPAWWGEAIRLVATIAVGACLLFFSVSAALALGLVVGSLFYPALATAVERELGLAKSELGDLPVWRQLAESLRHAAELLLWNGLCLVLSIVPVVGIVAPWLSFAGNSYLFGVEYLEIPMIIRGVARRERRRLLGGHRAQVWGLGSVVFLSAAIPVAGSLLLPPAVVGAVFQHRRLRDAKS